ncbi:MAG: hypothetical protein HGB19_03490 [Chlorobiales bacterium]|jgi:molybdate transport system regulatory protein|nr:hypothetical protein [Chlorobiales bacterium]
MNRLSGKIVGIESDEGISIVDVITDAGRLSALILETPDTAPYLKIDKQVFAIFKETEVAIGKGGSENISYLNANDGLVEGFNLGEVLAEIALSVNDKKIKSIITKRAFVRLDIKKGDRVKWIIKSNEISIESD